MGKKRIKTAAIIVSAITAISMSNLATSTAYAFDTSYISDDGMKLGYGIINGYSKMSVKTGVNSYDKTAIYSSLDITSPYILTLAGVFYMTNGVDLDKAIVDNDYTVELIGKLNSFLRTMGVRNERAERLKQKLGKDNVKVEQCFETAGMFVINSNNEYCNQLSNEDTVDFVLAGGEVPKTMKDLDLNGKSDQNDAKLIQKYLVGEFDSNDNDEKEYIKFACDINGDKTIDITDATELMQTKRQQI